MSAYLIVNFDMVDEPRYKAYQKGAIPALKIGSEAKLVALDSSSTPVEGSPGAHTVVLQFNSKEEAQAIYDSGDYQAVLGDRLEATTNHFCIIADCFDPTN